MRGLTGIELGASAIVLVHTRPGRARATRISAVHVGSDLGEVRPSSRFPRRARVVIWGLKHAASLTNSATHAMVAPLIAAGFHVDDVMSPPDALAALARLRDVAPPRTGTAWLALNRQGAAIAIMCDGELLYSREFEWRYRSANTPREELLQRYVLVAHLATELRHGLALVQQMHGRSVDGIVTCGNLPDLRSLTMPLIEELDMEVETLDSLRGLEVPPELADQIADNAPALQLACAAALRRVPLAPPVRVFSWPLAAAAAVLIAGAGLFWLKAGNRPAPSPSTEIPPAATPEAQAPPARGREHADVSRAPQVQSVRPAAPPMPGQPAATTGRRAPDAARDTEPRGTPSAIPQPRREPVRRGSPSIPLTEPLPVVNSIVVTSDRRLAVLNGAIVREGERIGSRVLIRIEPDGVLLREPSDHEVRVPLRRRVGSR